MVKHSLDGQIIEKFRRAREDVDWGRGVARRELLLSEPPRRAKLYAGGVAEPGNFARSELIPSGPIRMKKLLIAIGGLAVIGVGYWLISPLFITRRVRSGMVPGLSGAVC